MLIKRWLLSCLITYISEQCAGIGFAKHKSITSTHTRARTLAADCTSPNSNPATGPRPFSSRGFVFPRRKRENSIHLTGPLAGLTEMILVHVRTVLAHGEGSSVNAVGITTSLSCKGTLILSYSCFQALSLCLGFLKPQARYQREGPSEHTLAHLLVGVRGRHTSELPTASPSSDTLSRRYCRLKKQTTKNIKHSN